MNGSGVVSRVAMILVVAALLAACGGDGSRDELASSTLDRIDRAHGDPLRPERTYWFGGASPVSRLGATYVFRRNNASLVAWASELRAEQDHGAGQPRPRRVLVHIDAHSDAHPARCAPDEAGVRSFGTAPVETYAATLPISSFVMPALYYGWVDEVYWVQPPISGFQGVPESVHFDLIAQDGEIRPRTDNAWDGSGGAVASRGDTADEHGGRSFEIGSAYGTPLEDWIGDRFSIHLLSSAQFDSVIAAEMWDDREFLVDLDLDYFGSAGALRGYGLLEPLPGRAMAAGSRGYLVPAFALTEEEVESELSRIKGWIASLAPVVISISESPDHAFRDRLPWLERRVAEACGVDLGLSPDDFAPDVTLGAALLDPACETWVDLVSADSLTFRFAWASTPGESLEVSLYFDPIGARDHLAARWWIDGRTPAARVSVPLPLSRSTAGADDLFGSGWDIEVRKQQSGALLWTAAFALDRNGATLDALLAESSPTAGSGLELLGPRDERTASQLRRWAADSGWTREQTHKLLLAHPHTYEEQCEALARVRTRAGNVSAR